jgi:hypothetical protein
MLRHIVDWRGSDWSERNKLEPQHRRVLQSRKGHFWHDSETALLHHMGPNWKSQAQDRDLWAKLWIATMNNMLLIEGRGFTSGN